MAKRKREPNKVELNLTSMMDIVFLLIIFFILVTNFVSQELPELEVPEPHESKAINEESERVTVNVVPDPDKEDQTYAKFVVIGNLEFDPDNLGELTNLLIEEKASAEGREKKFEVDLRAHKTIQYLYVAPVMEAIVKAGIVDVNMVMKTKD
jgi:biopolymer transport protein ExbD